ncbi:MAG: translation initiation factor IF-2 [Brevefilum fermentans]|uniref:Translation initiation factor IF-2 n=2 Tax=Candidatus Brevifilum fermentans TaxID=1986204 RepID=A0A1Y6K279_9CHLR|nr:Translation initiation factor IF-2 [Brevefilum fermentans]
MSDTEMKKIILPSNISVRALAEKIEASPIEVIKVLMANGVMASINQNIDFDTAAVVASELGFEPELEKRLEEEPEEKGEIPFWRRVIARENEKDLVARPPVVTILGHVDHGKTTLLDAIRQTNVAAGEKGGITQHIGAYQIEHKGKKITFMDTPGHAAFTSMRARGAQGADIVILVVAADDGVMPQTREAANHAKAARVPIVVALNKMDLATANPELVKRQLAEIDLVPDEWDGDTMIVPVSAIKKQGLDDLLEAILLTADQIDIRANPKGEVLGTVVEGELDRFRGVLATLLLQNGTVKMGDTVLAGKAYGKIKAMFDYRGNRISKAGPSTPIVIMGLNEVPNAGDLFRVVASEKDARSIVAEIESGERTFTRPTKVTLEDLFEKMQAGETQELRLIIKADVQGSLEPITSSLHELGDQHPEVSIVILHQEIGNISESDVMLATASDAIVIGFAVEADNAAERLAEKEGVSIRLYTVIYHLLEDVEKAIKGMLKPEMVERVIGKANVLATFSVSRFKVAAGCRVISGEIRRNGHMRVIRDGKVIFDGEIASLKREKDDVREVREGFECGVALKNFHAFEVGDLLECYIFEKDAA